MQSKNPRTRKAIVNAFNHLIEREKFQEITIPQICQEAGISKATYYRYFRDKYDVMNENYRRILILYSRLPEVNSFQDLFRQFFLFSNKTHWMTIQRKSFRTEGVNSFRSYIADCAYTFGETVVRQNRDGAGYTEKERLQAHIFSEGVARMYEDWTFGRYELMPDTAAEALAEMLPATVRGLWLKEPIRPEDLQ